MKVKIAIFATSLAIVLFGLVPAITQASNKAKAASCCVSGAACCTPGAACCK